MQVTSLAQRRLQTGADHARADAPSRQLSLPATDTLNNSLNHQPELSLPACQVTSGLKGHGAPAHIIPIAQCAGLFPGATAATLNKKGLMRPQPLSFIRWPRWPGQTVSVEQRARALAVLRLINSWNRGRRGLQLDQIRGHKRRDRGEIFLQSLDTKMHIVIPIEPLGVRSGPLLHCLSGLKKRKVVGNDNFLTGGTAKWFPERPA